MHTEASQALHDALIAIVRAQVPEQPFLDDPEEVDPDDPEETDEAIEDEPPEPDDYVSPGDSDAVQARWERGR